MKHVLAVDPGPSDSGWVLWSLDDGVLMSAGHSDNELCRYEIFPFFIDSFNPSELVVVMEIIVSFGKVVGWHVFRTCQWIGRFTDMALVRGISVFELERQNDVGYTLLRKSRQFGNADIRREVIRRFGKPGTSRHPGPTRLASGDGAHKWQALGLVAAFSDLLASGRLLWPGEQPQPVQQKEKKLSTMFILDG